MPDQGIDLAQRKWSDRSAVERAPQKAGGGHAEVQRRRGGVRDGGRPGLFDEGEHAEEAPDADGPVMLVEVLAEGANAGPGPRGAGEQREGGAGRPRRPVRVVDAMPAAGRAERLPEEHPGGGGQEPPAPGPRPTAPARAARSTRAAHCRRPPRPRHSRRGARSGRRGGSSETARAGAAPAPGVPRQTSPRPTGWSCRGSGCRPSGFPSDRDMPGRRCASRSGGP